MLDSVDFQRYQSHLVLSDFGVQGQITLKKASVLVIGAGGLGSPLLYYLAGAGLGTIGILDYDKVSEHNLTRQILYRTNHVNKLKVDIASEQLLILNPHINIVAYPVQANRINLPPIIAKYDLIVDCTDNFETKFLLNDLCHQQQKTLISASALQYEGYVGIYNCHSGPCYRCIFESMTTKIATSCHIDGIFSPLLGILGSLQAVYVINYFLKKQANFLIHYNANSLQQKKIHLSVNPSCVLPHEDCNVDQSPSTMQILQLQDLNAISQQDFLLIDVRSQSEHTQYNIGGIWIPLDMLVNKLATISKQQCIVLYCSSGKRSRLGCEMLRMAGFVEVYCYSL